MPNFGKMSEALRTVAMAPFPERSPASRALLAAHISRQPSVFSVLRLQNSLCRLLFALLAAVAGPAMSDDSGGESISFTEAGQGPIDPDDRKYLLVTYMGGVTEEKNARLVGVLQAAAAHGHTDVILTIYSLGGHWNSAVSAAEIMRALPLRITTYAPGDLHSAAVLIYCAGKHRYASESANFLIHPLRMDHISDVKLVDLEAKKNLLEKQEIITSRMLTECFGSQDWKEVYSIPDRFFNLDEAKALGLVNREDAYRYPANLAGNSGEPILIESDD